MQGSTEKRRVYTTLDNGMEVTTTQYTPSSFVTFMITPFDEVISSIESPCLESALLDHIAAIVAAAKGRVD
mgnify:CR=1